MSGRRGSGEGLDPMASQRANEGVLLVDALLLIVEWGWEEKKRESEPFPPKKRARLRSRWLRPRTFSLLTLALD